MLKIVFYPPPGVHHESDYAGGPAYTRCLSGAKWASRIYDFPELISPRAQVRVSAQRNSQHHVDAGKNRKNHCGLKVFCPKFASLTLGYFKEAIKLAKYFRLIKGNGSCIHVNGVGCEVFPIAAKLAGFKNVFGTVHNLPGDYIEAKHSVRRFVEKISFRCCDHLIFPSYYCRERWRERVRIPASHQVIYHGCRLGNFRCECSQDQAQLQLGVHLNEDVFVLGVAGRLHECKGHDVLFRAIATISKEVKIAVIVAGHGPLEEKLLSLVETLGIGDRIIFIGQCDDMPLFYRAIDLNVLPSISEGLGYSVVEGMHAGLPQIVSDAGGMAELVRESRAGIVFPSEDSEALANAIIDMYRKRDSLDEYGHKAREYAERELTEERMLAKTLEFYEECLGAIRVEG